MVETLPLALPDAWHVSALMHETIERLGMDAESVRIAYWGSGGNAHGNQLAGFLAGYEVLPDREYNTLAATLNDGLIEAGEAPSIPYTEDHR